MQNPRLREEALGDEHMLEEERSSQDRIPRGIGHHCSNLPVKMLDKTEMPTAATHRGSGHALPEMSTEQKRLQAPAAE